MTILVAPVNEIDAPALPGVGTAVDQEQALEPLWQVIIHNDDVTPFDYVIGIL
ncbi:MAG: ATP-dependent Clp protease adaptor ClpS, partial [Caldilineaceae bacterium]|nr:ATP-dependent Clp protease adaptor ClpS [Caldilineaceae bacterium]